MYLKIIKKKILLKKNNDNNSDKSDSENFNESYDQRKIKNIQFESIKQTKEFKDLFKKENRIRRDIHGNLDFYNLIKGIAREFGRLDENVKVQIIEKYIERNFGGIDYEIDIDFNLKLGDIRESLQLIKDIINDYDGPNENKFSLFIQKII